MSAFAMRAIVKAGWPLVIDFSQEAQGPVDLRISAKGVPTYTWHLGGERTGVRQVILVLPPDFGNALKPALVAVTATRDGAPAQTLRPFRVLQLGAGPRAVPGLKLGAMDGSPRFVKTGQRERGPQGTLVLAGLMKAAQGSLAQTPAIDRFLFQPENIRARRGERSAYQFHAQSTFDSLAVEFLKLERGPDGLSHHIVNEQFIESGVRQDTWVGVHERRTWDGRDERQLVSSGEHKMQVRAWNDDGDWTTAWSESLLTVTD
jgi:hypothetical protein